MRLKEGGLMDSLKDNLERVRASINQVALSSNRDPKSILLLGVTKTVDVDVVESAIELGVEEVGENKPQELARKYDIIKDRVKWHQIGSLQTNKVKYLIDKVELIHSLDRVRLADEINLRADKIDRDIKCLVQVNMSGEESKHGLRPSDVEDFVRYCSSNCPRIRIVGMMTMAAADADEKGVRACFRGLRDLSQSIDRLGLDNVKMKELSMGMSGDYKIAIEEGSTIVRVGTSIFGKRDYSK